jgi:hypothetical protein
LKGEGKRVAAFHPEFIEDLSYRVDTERRTASACSIWRQPFCEIPSRESVIPSH